MGEPLPIEGLSDRIQAQLEHPRWAQVADRCLACTNCTLVCPTCFCTSVSQHTDLIGNVSSSERRWDSCFTLGFASVAGGNFRTRRQDRYRQWLTHKFGTWIDQFGIVRLRRLRPLHHLVPGRRSMCARSSWPSPPRRPSRSRVVEPTPRRSPAARAATPSAPSRRRARDGRHVHAPLRRPAARPSWRAPGPVPDAGPARASRPCRSPCRAIAGRRHRAHHPRRRADDACHHQPADGVAGRAARAARPRLAARRGAWAATCVIVAGGIGLAPLRPLIDARPRGTATGSATSASTSARGRPGTCSSTTTWRPGRSARTSTSR